MLEVTQADREAAAKWAKMQGRPHQAANMRRGACDTAPLVQAFARHRQAAIKERDAQLEEQQGVIKRLLTANRVLRQGLHGLVDSEDASEIATLLTTGQSVDWDAYPEATKGAGPC